MSKMRTNTTRTVRNIIIIGMFLINAIACAGWAGELVAWGQLSNAPTGNDFIAVSSSASHCVALKSDGSLISWGLDNYGQVSNTPAGTGFRAVAAGVGHSVAVKSDGSLIAWGWNVYGQVSDTPTGNDFVAVTAGNGHSVALKSDGSLVAWGYNRYYQVSRTPAGNNFIDVAAGDMHNVALKSDGSLVAWGYDSYGQVYYTPSDNDFVAVAAGGWHNVALKSNGSLGAWGMNADNQLINAPSNNDFVHFEAGYEHGVALKSDGSLVAWGRDNYGQVSDTPTGNNFIAVAAGPYYNVAIRDTQSPPPLPAVSIAATDASAGEPSNNGYFTVSRTGDTAGSLLVYYSTSGSTASSGSDYTALPGYVNIPAGQSSALISVAVIDDNTVENSETVHLTISSNAAYTIGSPSNATVTITDDDVTIPVVTITATDASAGEPSNNGSFTVSRTGDTAGNLLVYYSTSGSTASAGTDYAALSGYVYIFSGHSTASIPVDVIDDNTAENTESVRLTISSNAAYNIGSPSYATVTITDNDDEPPADGPVVTITAPDASAGEPSNDGYFRISRTGDTASSLRVYYSTSGSTASAGIDYATLYGYVYIPYGQTSTNVYVAVYDDNTMENSETVNLTISSNTAYTIGSPSNATVTIADDDNAPPEETPVVTITAPDASAGEPANDGYFRISRTGATTSSLLVYYSTSGSTASAGTDYTALPGYVYIPAGQSSVDISVAVIDDNTVENSEIVRLTISSNAAYTIGSPSYATVTITDDDYQQPEESVVTITAADPSAGEPANDGSFRISRTGDTAGSLLVYYSTSGSTASAGTDYSALPGYVYIPSGQSYVYVYVVVIDDNAMENSEIVRLTISSNAAYTVGSPSYATVTITDDDDVPDPPVDDVVQMMADTLTFFYASADDGSLVGVGKGKGVKELKSLQSMLETAYDQIVGGNYSGACGQLSDAYDRCDGQSNPTDYVSGSATSTLNAMIEEVMIALGC
jgi:hypothetical protein